MPFVKIDYLSYIGKKLGKLTVLDFLPYSKTNLAKFKCICECGSLTSPNVHAVIIGRSKSCGKCNPNRKTAYIGQKFGRLLILDVSYHQKKSTRFACACDCGNKVNPAAHDVITGKSRSCGCWKDEKTIKRSYKHGLAARGRLHRLYYTWSRMKARCGNPASKDYKWYGGRGIKVCERWMLSFDDFLTDMGEKPSAQHSIDRINNDGNYEPENCRWATQKEQVNNSRPRRKNSEVYQYKQAISPNK